MLPVRNRNTTLEQKNPMKKQDAIKIFDDKKVRTIWGGEQEKWYCSIVDTIEALTGSSIT